MSQPKFKLLPEFCKDPKMVTHLGGYREGEGRRVALSAANPFVVGAAYAKYEGIFLERVGTVVTEQERENLKRIAHSAKAAAPAFAPTLVQDAAPTLAEESSEPELVKVEDAPAPVVKPPELIISEEPEFILPSLETLNEQPKRALVAIIDRLGISDKVVPTGTNGLSLKADLMKALESYYATLPAPAPKDEDMASDEELPEDDDDALDE